MSSFENDIQNVFEGAEFQPSDRVWNGVEAALIAKKKKGIFFMWQTYGIAAGLAAILTLGFLYNDGFFDNGSMLPVEEISKTEEDKDTDDPNKSSTPDKLLKSSGSESLDKNTASIQNKSKPLNEQNVRTTGVTDKSLASTANSKTPLNTNDGQNVVQNTKNGSVEDNLHQAINLARVTDFDFSSLKAELKPYRKSLAAEKLLFNAKMALEPMTNSEELYSIMAAADGAGFTKENSLNGSLGNSTLNLSNNAGDFVSANNAEVRDPSSLSTLDASVESGEDQVSGAVSVGFGANFDLSRKLSLNLGARYSEFRFRNTSNAYSLEEGGALPIYLPVGFDSNNVFFVGEYEIENTIQSLFLQAMLNYKLVSFGKFDLSMSAGVGVDYFLAYKIKGELNFLETRKVNPSESNFLNRTNLSGVSGFGVNYRINRQLGLTGDINYRKFITPNKGDINATPSSVIGFGLSLNYFLNRKED